MPEQKTGQRLILNDGTIIENGRCGYADAHLWCFVTMTMIQAATAFLDPTKTERIVFEYGEMSDTYEGFTNCTNIFTDNDGKVSVCMTKG